MSLELQIILAFGLDLLVGDPRWFPHPVRLIGRLALGVEEPCRAIPNPRWAGMAAASAVVLVTAVASGALLFLLGRIHPLVGDMGSVVLMYTGIAARDMVRHSQDVYDALLSGALPEARRRMAMICGRDAVDLDEAGVARATVESVAENMVDGVTAPLLFAALAGPVGVMVYKAINTLDSTFGYRNERYLEFGWTSARLDDAANFIPARLTGILVPAAAFVLGLRAAGAFRTFLRDRRKHPSPNAGHAEAAVAGALGVQLGGLSHYGGKPSEKPRLGDPLVTLEPLHILQANNLLLLTSALALALLVGFRALLGHSLTL
jgi:adenosylcobinamide-phosphate synthase